MEILQVLGSGMSAKMWEVTVEHARTCVLDKNLYLYRPSGSMQSNGVVFNIVGQVTGLLSDCQYLPIDKLSETQKACIFALKVLSSMSVLCRFLSWKEICFVVQTYLVELSIV